MSKIQFIEIEIPPSTIIFVSHEYLESFYYRWGLKRYCKNYTFRHSTECFWNWGIVNFTFKGTFNFSFDIINIRKEEVNECWMEIVGWLMTTLSRGDVAAILFVLFISYVSSSYSPFPPTHLPSLLQRRVLVYTSFSRMRINHNWVNKVLLEIM